MNAVQTQSTKRRRMFAAVAALLAVSGGLVVAPAGADVPDISVPEIVMYSAEFPTQNLAVGFTTSMNAEAIRLNVGTGWVTGGSSCTSDAGSYTLSAVGGSGFVGSAIPAATTLTCNLQITPTAPGQVTVTVEEFDELGPANTQHATIDAQLVAVTWTSGPVERVTGNWSAGEALAPGDILRYDATFRLDGFVEAQRDYFELSLPLGTTITCQTETLGTGSVTVPCTVSRVLTTDDLVAGVAPMTFGLIQVPGGTLGELARSVPVSAEHRVELSMSALPNEVAVAGTTAVTLTATNVGSVALTNLAFEGFPAAELEAANCRTTATLTAGSRWICTFDHVVTLAEVTNPVAPRVRGSSFDVDSDGVNDSTTAPTDIDAQAASDLTALGVGLTVTRLDQPAPIALPVAGTVTAVGIVDLASALPVGHVRLRVGVTNTVAVQGCTPLDGLCDIAVPAGLPVVDVPLVVTAQAANAGLNVSLPVRVLADGGIDLPVGSLLIRTFGVSVEVGGRRDPVDAGTASSMTWPTTFTLAAGPISALSATIVPLGSSLSACTAGGQPVVVVSSPEGISLGTHAGGVSVMCTVTSPIPDHVGDGIDVQVTARVLNSGVQALAVADASARAAELEVSASPIPAVPTHGYSVAGGAERPNHFTQTFAITIDGDTAVTAISTPTGVTCDGDSLAAPVDDETLEIICSVRHTVSAADLQVGRVLVTLPVTGTAFDGALALVSSSSVWVPVPHESMSVRLSELTAPPSGPTYAAGDVVRLLVSVYNDGGLPLEVLSVQVGPNQSMPDPPAGLRTLALGARTAGLGSCVPTTLVAPQSGFECLVDYTVTPFDQAAGSLSFTATVHTSQGITATGHNVLSVARREVELPATGARVLDLVSLAGAAVLIGLFLTAVSRRRWASAG